MFIAVLIVTAGVTIVMTSQLNDITNSARVSQNQIANKLRTDVIIDHLHYNASQQQITIYLKNIGSTSLNINQMSVYINNQYFRMNGTNAPAVILSDTDSVNVGYFDNNEIAQINVSMALTPLQQHTAKIITQYDTQTTRIFTS